jgi:hypothetical protein
MHRVFLRIGHSDRFGRLKHELSAYIDGIDHVMGDMVIAPGGGGGLLVQAARNLAGQVRQGCPGRAGSAAESSSAAPRRSGWRMKAWCAFSAPRNCRRQARARRSSADLRGPSGARASRGRLGHARPRRQLQEAAVERTRARGASCWQVTLEAGVVAVETGAGVLHQLDGSASEGSLAQVRGVLGAAGAGHPVRQCAERVIQRRG